MAETGNGFKPGQRVLFPILAADGGLYYSPILTPRERTDPVALVKRNVDVMPIVFVPGIMGSNLRSTDGKKTQVWRFDGSVSIARNKMGQDPELRQALLHPDRTEVDPEGKVPSNPVGVLQKRVDFLERGWGEVAAASYMDFLIWMEETFNGQRSHGCNEASHNAYARQNQDLRKIRNGQNWGAQNPDFSPLTDEESARAERWSHPVYACGYNWLNDNGKSALLLAQRIESIIKSNNRGFGRCSKVILVTHSMGGSTARRCAQLPRMREVISGIVHGVMPATGAAVAYRRCKVGMKDEDAAVSLVIGRLGMHVTAVFAQAPGALQLLPTQQYPRDWLEIRHLGMPVPLLKSMHDPYEVIYLERFAWWGLIREEWLALPDAEKPTKWEDYSNALGKAKVFHTEIKDSYHPVSYAFYGKGQKSFEKIIWEMTWAARRARPKQTTSSDKAFITTHRSKTIDAGDNPIGLRVEEDLRPPDASGLGGNVLYKAWLATAKESGDGTVPEVSGAAPVHSCSNYSAFPASPTKVLITRRLPGR